MWWKKVSETGSKVKIRFKILTNLIIKALQRLNRRRLKTTRSRIRGGGLMRNIINFWRRSESTVKTGIWLRSTSVQEMQLTLDLMPKSFSQSWWSTSRTKKEDSPFKMQSSITRFSKEKSRSPIKRKANWVCQFKMIKKILMLVRAATKPTTLITKKFKAKSSRSKRTQLLFKKSWPIKTFNHLKWY